MTSRDLRSDASCSLIVNHFNQALLIEILIEDPPVREIPTETGSCSIINARPYWYLFFFDTRTGYFCLKNKSNLFLNHRDSCPCNEDIL